MMRTRKQAARYMEAHPDSILGDYEEAWACGFTLVAIKPNGLLVYRKRSWLARLLGV